jgi:hypothetical protein
LEPKELNSEVESTDVVEEPKLNIVASTAGNVSTGVIAIQTVKCNYCGFKRRLPLRSNYNPFHERAQVDFNEFQPNL